MTYLADRHNAVLDAKIKAYLIKVYGYDYREPEYSFMTTLVQRDYLAFQQNEFERKLLYCGEVFPPVGLGTIGLLGTVT